MEKMPVFVKVEEYDNVLNLLKTIRAKLEEAKTTITKISELKNEEDHQVEMWQSTLTEIEKKIEFIDQSLTEPEQF